MKRTGEHVKVWDVINENLTLPNDDHTHYWCKIFEAPQLEEKHHMIGVRSSLYCSFRSICVVNSDSFV